MKTLSSFACALAVLLAGPAAAHHSFAMFDLTKETKLTGIVKSFQWTNPHVFVELAVQKDGVEQVWLLEGAAILSLRRNGWRADSFKPGDTITADVRPLKDGRIGGQLLNVTLKDGTFLYGASPQDLLQEGKDPSAASPGLAPR